MKGNAVIGQAGGPTAVINSSLAGVMSACGESSSIRTLYGSAFGIEGILEGRLFPLSKPTPEFENRLKATPSSALGSSRYKLKDEDLPKILDVLRRNDIRYFFLIGGNDTMETVHRVERYCGKEGYDLRGVGIPKTVDNDLPGTDHTPGFPSAARATIMNVRQAGLLARDMRRVDKFVVYQTIGRNAGWLAAASALARDGKGTAPHLIYCPEKPFSRKRFLADAERCFSRYGWAYIVAGEGLLWEDGTPVSATKVADAFGNREFGASGGSGVGMVLHKILTEETGARGEFQIPESLLMCAADRIESGDVERAFHAGRKAVEEAERDGSGVMIALTRTGKGSFGFGTVPLDEVAGKAKLLPDLYIAPEGCDVTGDFLAYMEPLISELPRYARLDLEEET